MIGYAIIIVLNIIGNSLYVCDKPVTLLVWNLYIERSRFHVICLTCTSCIRVQNPPFSAATSVIWPVTHESTCSSIDICSAVVLSVVTGVGGCNNIALLTTVQSSEIRTCLLRTRLWITESK